MIADYDYLWLWEKADTPESIEGLRERVERLWGAEARSGFMSALNVLLSARLIRREGNEWRLTQAGIQQRQHTPEPPRRPQAGTGKNKGAVPSAPGQSTGLNATASAAPSIAPSGPSAASEGAATSVTRAPRSSLESADTTPGTGPDSQCADLRRLLAYYTDCVRYDERPSIALYGDGYNRTFLPLIMWETWWADAANQAVSPLGQG